MADSEQVEASHEANLARQIQIQRERRGWSLSDLARRMTSAGCKLHPSAIHKIEAGSRRINLNEAVAYAQVFEMTLQAMLQDPGVLATREGLRLWKKYEQAQERYLAARRDLEDVEGKLLELIDSPEGFHAYAEIKDRYGSDARRTIYQAMVQQEQRRASQEGRADGQHQEA